MSLEQRTLGSPQSSREEEATEAEPQAQADHSMVLVSRKSVYTIITVLGVTMLGCACALAFSLSNYNILKRNDDYVSNFIASRARVVDGQSENLSVAVGLHRTTARALLQAYAAERNGPRLDVRAQRRFGDSIGQPPTNGSLPEAARQESFDPAVTGAVEEDVEPPATASEDFDRNATCCDMTANSTEDGFAEAP